MKQWRGCFLFLLTVLFFFFAIGVLAITLPSDYFWLAYLLGFILTLVFMKYIFKPRKKQESIPPKPTSTVNANVQLNTEELYEYKNESEFENSIDFNLSGVHVKGRKTYIINNVFEGDDVELFHDKRNKHSTKAIGVKHDGRIIGYVPETDIDNVYPFLNNEYESYVLLIEDYDDFLEVSIQFEYNNTKYQSLDDINAELEDIEFPDEIQPIKKSKKRGRKNPNIESYSDILDFQDKKIDRKYLYPIKDLEDTSHFFYGKKVVISGDFKDYPDRNDLAKLFWSVGADIDTSVGKKTNFLIAGTNAGPKKKETAKEQGITIVNQSQLRKFFPLDNS